MKPKTRVGVRWTWGLATHPTWTHYSETGYLFKTKRELEKRLKIVYGWLGWQKFAVVIKVTVTEHFP